MEIFLFSFSEAYGLEIFTQNSMEIPKWILLLFTIVLMYMFVVNKIKEKLFHQFV